MIYESVIIRELKIKFNQKRILNKQKLPAFEALSLRLPQLLALYPQNSS